jgi:HSP20 family protein
VGGLGLLPPSPKCRDLISIKASSERPREHAFKWAADRRVPPAPSIARETTMAQDIKKQEPAAPAPRYRDPFAEMRAEMDRIFDSFLGRGLFGRTSLPQVTARAFDAPDVDIRENDKEIVLEAELPGIDEKDVNVLVRDGVLSLKGEKKFERDEKKDTYHLTERSYGAFERMFRLPDSVDQDKIKANFEKGVLRIVVPKRPEAIAAEKKIPIQKS